MMIDRGRNDDKQVGGNKTISWKSIEPNVV